MAKTQTAITLNALMLIADQMEDLEGQLDYARRTGGNPDTIARLQDTMASCHATLESAWDAWNDALRDERLARV
jgi:hypothetical protein